MIIIWSNHQSKSKYFWISMGPFLGISAEIGQFFNIVSGTFDVIDFLFCIIGSVLPFIFLYKKKNIQYN